MGFAQEYKERSSLFNEVLNACSYILKHDKIAKHARDYLDSRVPKDYQDKYNFGYFPSNDNLRELTSLIDLKILKQIGLVYCKNTSGVYSPNGHFDQHNLILSFKDVYGDVISLVGRTLLSEEERNVQNIQKYKYTFGADRGLHVFGLHDAKSEIIKKNKVILVEGQFDCITCHSLGIKNVVALGSATMTKYQFYCLNKYTNNFNIIFDNDVAGKNGKLKIKKNFSTYANIQGINVPSQYKDIDEWIQKSKPGIKEKLIEWLNNL